MTLQGIQKLYILFENGWHWYCLTGFIFLRLTANHSHGIVLLWFTLNSLLVKNYQLLPEAVISCRLYPYRYSLPKPIKTRYTEYMCTCNLITSNITCYYVVRTNVIHGKKCPTMIRNHNHVDAMFQTTFGDSVHQHSNDSIHTSQLSVDLKTN